MTTIELKSGYYIEIDPLNYTLRKRYVGQTRDGEKRDAARTCGYFGDIRKAVERYLDLVQMDISDGEITDMKQYVDLIEKSNALAIQGIAEELRRFPVK